MTEINLGPLENGPHANLIRGLAEKCTADATIVDFYVQDTLTRNPEPSLVILTCRSDELREVIESFASSAAPLAQAIDNKALRQFYIDYWITTHKEMKGLTGGTITPPSSGFISNDLRYYVPRT